MADATVLITCTAHKKIKEIYDVKFTLKCNLTWCDLT